MPHLVVFEHLGNLHLRYFASEPTAFTLRVLAKVGNGFIATLPLTGPQALAGAVDVLASMASRGDKSAAAALSRLLAS